MTATTNHKSILRGMLLLVSYLLLGYVTIMGNNTTEVNPQEKDNPWLANHCVTTNMEKPSLRQHDVSTKRVDQLLTVTGSVVGTQQLQKLCRLSRHFTDENLTIVLQVLLSLQ